MGRSILISTPGLPPLDTCLLARRANRVIVPTIVTRSITRVILSAVRAGMLGQKPLVTCDAVSRGIFTR